MNEENIFELLNEKLQFIEQNLTIITNNFENLHEICDDLSKEKSFKNEKKCLKNIARRLKKFFKHSFSLRIEVSELIKELGNPA